VVIWTNSWRQQPGTPAYCRDLESAALGRALAEADRSRIAEYRAEQEARIRRQYRSPVEPYCCSRSRARRCPLTRKCLESLAVPRLKIRALNPAPAQSSWVSPYRNGKITASRREIPCGAATHKIGIVAVTVVQCLDSRFFFKFKFIPSPARTAWE